MEVSIHYRLDDPRIQRADVYTAVASPVAPDAEHEVPPVRQETGPPVHLVFAGHDGDRRGLASGCRYALQRATSCENDRALSVPRSANRPERIT